MPPRALGLALMWILSSAPLVAPASWLGPSGLSRSALSVLPWLVAVGLPRSPVSTKSRFLRGTERTPPWIFLAFALPCAALGLRLDVDSGFDLVEHAYVVGVSLASACALADAATQAARVPRLRALHAIAWIAFIPGFPLVALSLSQGGRPSYGDAPAWLAGFAGASPVAWLCRRISLHGPGASASVAALAVATLGPLLVCLGLSVIARWPRPATEPH